MLWIQAAGTAGGRVRGQKWGGVDLVRRPTRSNSRDDIAYQSVACSACAQVHLLQFTHP